MIKSNDGRIAIGWLVVEDLLMVLTLVLLPALTGVLGGRAITPATAEAFGRRSGSRSEKSFYSLD